MGQTAHPWNGISELFHSSIRATSERKIGAEIERIGGWLDGSTVHYEDRILPTGVSRIGARTLLTKLGIAQPTWIPSTSTTGNLIGFTTPLGKVSLEPGSQLELSSQPAETLHSVKTNVDAFDAILKSITDPMGIYWMSLGMNPWEAVEEVDVIGAPRYHIMTDYLGRRGKLGTSMMRLTTSVQINLDYTSETEAIEMLRTSLALAPISYALFANSPISKGKANGFLSFRQQIWTDTDPDRTGLLKQAFQPDFNFSSYASIIWHQPLMFAQNSRGEYVPGQGKSLADISRGVLPDVAADENNQMNAVREYFTEARLKPGYVEVRSIDGLSPRDRYASIAFWVGILYSAHARKLAMDLLGNISPEERDALAVAAAREGLKVTGLKEIALKLVDAAKITLQERAHQEEAFLQPIYENLAEDTNPADRVLKLFHGPWQHQVAPLIQHGVA